MARPITLLARLSQAAGTRAIGRLRSTDWWAVLVEIVVVVLGIVIAFELNDWDRRRQARNEEEAILRHLDEETNADLAAIGAIAREHRQSTDNYFLLVAAQNDLAAQRAYRERGAAGCNLLRMPAVRYHSPSGLEANDRAEIINDGELRHLIRRANAERAFNDRQLEYFRDAFNRYALVLEPHMEWRLTRSRAMICVVDVDGLLSDRAALHVLPKAARDQQRFGQYRERELEAVKAVARRTDCLRRRCAS